jgi:glycine/D-amino acid oxidase-like deaminating enzyme
MATYILDKWLSFLFFGIKIQNSAYRYNTTDEKTLRKQCFFFFDILLNMFENKSPWLKQLDRTRPVHTHDNFEGMNYAIIGGGIAGVVTAYMLLKHTDKKVVLFEQDQIAHGATGHNAGQVVGYFERPLFDIAHEYGKDHAIKAQQALERGWIILDEILADTALQTPMSSFIKSVGLTHQDQILRLLKDNDIKASGGLPVWPIFIEDELPLSPEFDEYVGLWKRTTKENILEMLESKDSRYVALGQEKAGCMNSALFTEELAGYLLREYSSRFAISEKTPVLEIELHLENATMKTPLGDIRVDNVILCTNGFENIALVNKEGADIDVKFHHRVRGYVGYMAGYTDENGKPPTALTYINNPESKMESSDSYFYLTRRPYESRDDRAVNLISVGGPGVWLDSASEYSKKDMYPEDAQKNIDEFVKNTYCDSPENISYEFKWHGLMGFTQNYLRIVGREPCNPVLLYNLGCNGVGILPSLFGGERIAHILRGDELEPTVFDPKDVRCENPKLE